MEEKRSREIGREEGAQQFAASAVEPNFENVKRQKTNGQHEARVETETEIAIFSSEDIACTFYIDTACKVF